LKNPLTLKNVLGNKITNPICPAQTARATSVVKEAIYYPTRLFTGAQYS